MMIPRIARRATYAPWTLILFYFFSVTAVNSQVNRDGYTGVDAGWPTRPPTASLPNIVVIVSDDQDELSLPVEWSMAHTRKHVLEKGVHFARAFANTPVCCPSRATLLTGRYPHSPGMTKSNRINCGGTQWRAGPELDTVAVRVQEQGYRTMFCGKYLNTYGMGDPLPSQIPPGWNEWFALVGNSKYWNYSVSDEGFEAKFGSLSGGGDYLTDALARRVVSFIRSSSATHPFMVWVAPPAAHAPFAPAERHMGSWSRMTMPRSLAFNSSVDEKHEPVSLAKPLGKDQAREVEEIYRARGEALQSVDDMVLTIISVLKERALDNKTFIIYTSDNGFHHADYRLPFDKRQPYETDIRIPLVVTGPGVLRNLRRYEYVSHVDLAPTVVDLAQAPVPPDWDGRSFKNLLFEESAKSLGELILIEYEGEADPITNGNLFCGAGRTTFDEFGRARADGQFKPSLCDSWNNTYSCLRGSSSSFMRMEFLFCQFECYVWEVQKASLNEYQGEIQALKRGAKTKVPCDKSSINSVGEFYNLSKDPYQLDNIIKHLSWNTKKKLTKQLEQLKKCRGALDCSIARSGIFTVDEDSYIDIATS